MNVNETAWQVVATGLLAEDKDDTNTALAELLQRAGDLWPQIVHLADSNFVTPGLWKALTDRGLGGLVPEDPAQYLRAMYEMNEARNASLENQLDEIIRALTTVGITPGLIKGAAHLKTGSKPFTRIAPSAA